MPYKRLIPHCRDTQLLLSQAQDTSLSLLTRARIRMHLWTCTACTRFSQQLSFIRQAMQRFDKE
ncbi:zinc-finger family protein [Collimonas arenae]|uniref:Zinc-finger family protein n=1 Tax=Collimonas arenae TaxID=279058 RepID=A0A127QG63_9BURK|nr:zf-HC2 domain-containing protein [Collimonas arenae]AMO98905.1 zinc-finger family protein [Collimonas arenae]AMP08795.1 zinc-finger family protein [Collimonas arenae]